MVSAAKCCSFQKQALVCLLLGLVSTQHAVSAEPFVTGLRRRQIHADLHDEAVVNDDQQRRAAKSKKHWAWWNKVQARNHKGYKPQDFSNDKDCHNGLTMLGYPCSDSIDINAHKGYKPSDYSNDGPCYKGLTRQGVPCSDSIDISARAQTSEPTQSPSDQPTTDAPSPNPTKAPTTEQPTATPSKAPTTDVPTASPSALQTANPTNVPTASPTDAPSASPTDKPSESPTNGPTDTPSKSPTATPTASPTTLSPTPNPSASPTTARPSATPTTLEPTANPSASPTTAKPSASPTTLEPTANPSAKPTTEEPSASPSSGPSASPTAVPSEGPSASPTSHPSASPTAVPSEGPSSSPSSSPSASPTAAPSAMPSSSPTSGPSASPTASSSPTSGPSASPTAAPSAMPSSSPTSGPSALPTASSSPTSGPSASPTAAPSAMPSSSPTSGPSASPTAAPSAMPSSSPTSGPSASPTAAPSERPSASPSSSPSASPTVTHSEVPSSSPSVAPSTAPSDSPTSSPSARPSSLPSLQPTASPSASPTTAEPSATPTTLKPTASPSASPTTAKPSESPTTLEPTASPSASPTTAKPSATPTTLEPTVSPSASPPTLARVTDGTPEDVSVSFDTTCFQEIGVCVSYHTDNTCNMVVDGVSCECCRYNPESMLVSSFDCTNIGTEWGAVGVCHMNTGAFDGSSTPIADPESDNTDNGDSSNPIVEKELGGLNITHPDRDNDELSNKQELVVGFDPSNADSNSLPTLAPVTDEPTTATPSSLPTVAPVTDEPTHSPTLSPVTDNPTSSPTLSPVTDEPTTAEPSSLPTLPHVTNEPTTTEPSQLPTLSPVTDEPTAAEPSSLPTLPHVTSDPTDEPTKAPASASPTQAPITEAPISANPTASPSAKPTLEVQSSQIVTGPVTDEPTTATDEPTTDEPSSLSTLAPVTDEPTVTTDEPTTDEPSSLPTLSPVSEVERLRTTAEPTASPVIVVADGNVASVGKEEEESATDADIYNSTGRGENDGSGASDKGEGTTDSDSAPNDPYWDVDFAGDGGELMDGTDPNDTRDTPSLIDADSESDSGNLSSSTNPTNTPTSSPTHVPSTSPTTLSPTPNPSASPTTAEPSATPTTFEPTVNPSASPTTAEPTFMPTVFISVPMTPFGIEVRSEQAVDHVEVSRVTSQFLHLYFKEELPRLGYPDYHGVDLSIDTASRRQRQLRTRQLETIDQEFLIGGVADFTNEPTPATELLDNLRSAAFAGDTSKAVYLDALKNSNDPGLQSTTVVIIHDSDYIFNPTPTERSSSPGSFSKQEDNKNFNSFVIVGMTALSFIIVGSALFLYNRKTMRDRDEKDMLSLDSDEAPDSMLLKGDLGLGHSDSTTDSHDSATIKVPKELDIEPVPISLVRDSKAMERAVIRANRNRSVIAKANERVERKSILMNEDDDGSKAISFAEIIAKSVSQEYVLESMKTYETETIAEKENEDSTASSFDDLVSIGKSCDSLQDLEIDVGSSKNENNITGIPDSSAEERLDNGFASQAQALPVDVSKDENSIIDSLGPSAPKQSCDETFASQARALVACSPKCACGDNDEYSFHEGPTTDNSMTKPIAGVPSIELPPVPITMSADKMSPSHQQVINALAEDNPSTPFSLITYSEHNGCEQQHQQSLMLFGTPSSNSTITESPSQEGQEVALLEAGENSPAHRLGISASPNVILVTDKNAPAHRSGIVAHSNSYVPISHSNSNVPISDENSSVVERLGGIAASSNVLFETIMNSPAHRLGICAHPNMSIMYADDNETPSDLEEDNCSWHSPS